MRELAALLAVLELLARLLAAGLLERRLIGRIVLELGRGLVHASRALLAGVLLEELGDALLLGPIVGPLV